MKRIVNAAFLFPIILLIGCSFGKFSVPPNANGLSTPTPNKTAPAVVNIATIESETPTSTPAATETPPASTIAVTINPTYLIFPTQTSTPTLDPSLILLRIVSPGPMSKVVTPIEFIVHIAPEYTGTTRIELIGEDGVELYRKVFKSYSNIVYYTRINEKIQFEINGAAEMARLQISTLDGKSRVIAINSVRLLLQSVGENVFTPPYGLQDRVLLRYPTKTDEIRGGTLPVTGEFQPVNDLPLNLELIDDDGKVLGSRILQLDPTNGKYQQFTTTIPYQVTKKNTPVLLVLRQSDDRIEGPAYLFSTRIVVSP